jgi:hypothetical protein
MHAANYVPAHLAAGPPFRGSGSACWASACRVSGSKRAALVRQHSSGSAQIARINPDGSHRDQLTHTSTKHNSLFSDWSPNGREVAFDSDRTGAW